MIQSKKANYITLKTGKLMNPDASGAISYEEKDDTVSDVQNAVWS